MSSILSFLSFPNYRPLVQSNRVVKSGTYTTIEDIIRHLCTLHFQIHSIRELYTAFQESPMLRDTLRTVRACVIQVEPVCCTIDKLHVLENKNKSVVSERVIYIQMYNFTGGHRRQCNSAFFLYVFLSVFAIVGICICQSSFRHMLVL
jgi:hypothetical protein